MEKKIKQDFIYDVDVMTSAGFTEIRQEKTSGLAEMVLISNDKLPGLIEFLTSIVNEQK